MPRPSLAPIGSPLALALAPRAHKRRRALVAAAAPRPLPGKPRRPLRPSDAYVDYVAAIGNAGTLGRGAALPHRRRPQAARDRPPETLKAKVPGGVLKIVDEQVAGDKATVVVSGTIQEKGKERPSQGTVVMLRQGGAWKVDQETWVPQP